MPELNYISVGFQPGPPLPNHPLLLQLNTRIILTERSQGLGRSATLDDITDADLDGYARQGFRCIWLLGLWQTGERGRLISRTHPGIREECARDLPDLRDGDICGSPFAIRQYHAHADFGGDAALARLRRRMADRDIKLIADFVVNHVAPDHPWLESHPEWFIIGTEQDIAAAPGNWIRLPTGEFQRESIVAHGRDPYFPGWADTVQLNLRHPGCREAMVGELERIASQCDGVRCDMAMLAQADVILQTWGDRSLPADGSLSAGTSFWPEAIRRIKAARADFLFIAEVYWDREGQLQEEGFDFTYDKRLYDRLRRGEGLAAREHLQAGPAFQDRSLRFLENHDEPRAAAAFPADMHRAAALITFFVPGMRFFHEGQLDGRQARVSMHLQRRPLERANKEWKDFYGYLLEVLQRTEFDEGHWTLLPPLPGWEGNPTSAQFVAFAWNHLGLPGLLGVVNFGPTQGQCHVRLVSAGFEHESIRLKDIFSDAYFVRKTKDVAGPGMFFDLPPWGFHLLEIL